MATTKLTTSGSATTKRIELFGLIVWLTLLAWTTYDRLRPSAGTVPSFGLTPILISLSLATMSQLVRAQALRWILLLSALLAMTSAFLVDWT